MIRKMTINLRIKNDKMMKQVVIGIMTLILLFGTPTSVVVADITLGLAPIPPLHT